jgi:hypothetical protein
MLLLLLHLVTATLFLTEHPPRGVNSFDIQYDRRANKSVPIWNETEFRKLATAMATQLLPAGYDTIVIDGGWAGETIDGHGRPTPNVAQWPSAAGGKGFKPLADWTHALGLKFGVWTLRGVLPAAVTSKLPVLGSNPPVTLDQVAQVCTSPHDRWCNCTWDKQGVGLDPTHPAAQSFYNSQVDLYASWGVDLIKWDCMYENSNANLGMPSAYAGEAVLALNAVKASDRNITLSWSPGGGMSVDSAAWMTDSRGEQHAPANVTSPAGVRGSMFRATGDFHSRPVNWVDGLGEHLFVLGNLSTRNLIGANKVYADSDILDLGPDSAFFNTPAAQLHSTMWMMSKSPLMYGGQLPIADANTLNLVTNKLALLINSHSSSDMAVSYQGNCSCRPKSGYACHPRNSPGAAPCVATWWSSLGPKCKAVAVLNVGAVAAPSVDVRFDEIGFVASGKQTVTDVYAQKTRTIANDASFKVAVPPMGGVLLVVAPGEDPAACAGPGVPK